MVWRVKRMGVMLAVATVRLTTMLGRVVGRGSGEAGAERPAAVQGTRRVARRRGGEALRQ